MCFSLEVNHKPIKTALEFGAIYKEKDFQRLEESIVSHPKIFKKWNAEGRIFPNTFAPVIMLENDQRVLTPMRYRLIPSSAKNEIPSKYNVFNARLDSLETRKTWRPLFTTQHALLPFHLFYEWVEGVAGKKKLIKFKPTQHAVMWAPALYDYWEDKSLGIGFYSFAIITTDPPPEIQEMGHDRCPIFIEEQDIDRWLRCRSKKEAYAILNRQEKEFFESIAA